jgi:hypothetical protein
MRSPISARMAASARRFDIFILVIVDELTP